MSQEQSYTRSDSLYVSYVVRKCLNYIAMTEIDQSGDGVAERELLAWIKTKHPEILKHVQDHMEVDRKFRDSLKAQKPDL